MRLLLKESYQRAFKCIEMHRKELDIIANGLIQYESLSGGEIVDLLNGKKPNMAKGGQRSQRPSREAKSIPILPNKTNKNQTNVSSSSSSSNGIIKPTNSKSIAQPPFPPVSSSSQVTPSTSVIKSGGAMEKQNILDPPKSSQASPEEKKSNIVNRAGPLKPRSGSSSE